jgi:hypothetical protein
MNRILIIARDKVGLLSDVTKILAKHKINIEDIDGYSFKGMAAICIAVDQYERALKLLTEASFTAVPEENLVIQLDDVPGALAKVAKKLKTSGINIRRLQIIMRDRKHSLVGITIEEEKQTKKAIKLLKDVLLFPR